MDTRDLLMHAVPGARNVTPNRRYGRPMLSYAGRISLTACALAIALGPAPAPARVFQRLGRLSAAETFKTAGGTIAYEADVTINGGDGHLTAAGFTTTLREALAGLRRFFNTDEIPLRTSGLVQATLRHDDTVTRLLVFSLGAKGRTMAIAVTQSESEFDRSSRTPDQHLQKGIPAFPGSRPRFFVADEEAGMSLAVTDTPANAGAAHAHFGEALRRDGWATLLRDTSRNRLQVYWRNNETCCVFAGPAGGALSGTIIAVLHKHRRVQ